jgi:hypothetical protein
MITRRGFFGAVAALAVGSRVPVAAAPIAPVIGGINPATFPFWRSQTPSSQSFDELRVAMSKIYEQCSRDDGDTILELR